MNPFNVLFAWPIALSLYGITAIAATYGALVPSRPQRVDGFQATAEYARENGLSMDSDIHNWKRK